MNKKIKVIELLNKIANGEKVPIEIKFQNIIYVFNKECNQYYEKGKGSYFENKLSFDKTIEWNFYGDYLNAEVEILEDNTEEIEEYKGESFEQLGYELGKMFTAIVRGLIKAVNEMEKPTEKEHCCCCGVEITDENRALHNMCKECKYGIDWEEKTK